MDREDLDRGGINRLGDTGIKRIAKETGGATTTSESSGGHGLSQVTGDAKEGTHAPSG